MYTTMVSKCQAWPQNRAFSPCGPHLCKSIGTKESVYVRKGLTPLRLVWNTNMAALPSCVNAL